MVKFQPDSHAENSELQSLGQPEKASWDREKWTSDLKQVRMENAWNYRDLVSADIAGRILASNNLLLRT